MTTVINTNKINNILFFNPKIIKDNDYKRGKYNNLLEDTQSDLIILPSENITERKKVSEFKKFRENLYKGIRSSGKFCDGIQSRFVKESLRDCDAVLRVESSMTRSKKINGFATLKFYKGSKSLYIDIICTNTNIKGTGSYMIKLLNDFCKENGLENIKLSSLTQAVPFYLKTDFECNPMCKMIKDVTGGGSKTRKNRGGSHNKTKSNR
jgi:hypothetical protein